MESSQMKALEQNRDNYEMLYGKDEAFLRHPADWVIRFHNIFLKHNIRKDALLLDYGCGAGNNSIFFLQKGYSVYGVDVAHAFKRLLAKNFELHNIDNSLLTNFSVINPDSTVLDFADGTFDFVLSNQVLYYLPSEDHIKKVCYDIKRILRPNGFVFFTMIGLRNYYISHYLKQVHSSQIYEIEINDAKHRLNGIHEFLLPIRDEEHLCSMFDMFEPVTTGYFDQKLFDVHSNFHYIFVGKNSK